MSVETHVHFEHLDKPDRVEGISRLLLRRGRLTPHVLILCPDDGFVAQLNERLWTIHPESFLAHGVASPDQMANARHPILLYLTDQHAFIQWVLGPDDEEWHQ